MTTTAPPRPSNTHWRLSAACAQIDPELWYSDDHADRTQARKICHRCDVLKECHDTATLLGEQHGTWAATDRDRKRTPAKRRKRTS